MSAKFRERAFGPAAFWCHFLANLLLLLAGLVYLTRGQFMPYHGIAVGKSWQEVEPGFQVLVLALMRSLGGATLGAATANLIMLWIPFRDGQNWARWAVPVVFSLAIIPATVAAQVVDRLTPAVPPWKLGLVLLLISAVGGVLSFCQAKKGEHSSKK